MNGLLFEGNDALQICFQGTTPLILKVLLEDEILRAKQLNAEFDEKLLLSDTNTDCFTFHNITLFRLLEANRKVFMLMPLFPTTLEHLSQLDEAGTVKLWQQISVALDTLHNKQMAHMDVKPANICITSRGDFVLTDLGSVAKFGEHTDSTRVYLPSDISTHCAASALIDWLMFAMTICEKTQLLKIGVRPTTDELKTMLSNRQGIFPAICIKLEN